MSGPILYTPRLKLRLPKVGDFPLYRGFFSETGGSSASYGGPLEPHRAFQRLAADLGHWHLKGFGKFVLERHHTAAPIGGCGIVHPEGWPSHELTWWLLPSARGHGFATEASQAVLDWAYGQLGWSAVETHMRDENTAARALTARLGGRVIRREIFPDGIARDVFALPRAETAMRERGT
ncbi:MAG: GNAT family N-acetyltransferase [Pseudomonadota bacterium]